MRSTLFSLFLALLGLCWSAPAFAEGRFALVIGNNNYGASVGPLTNAVADAELVSQTLKGLGFDVVERYNAYREDMVSGLSELQNKVAQADPATAIVLVYFAGHGVQVRNQNYLLPVDTELNDVSIEATALTAGTFLRAFGNAGTRRNILVLDACREDPYANEPSRARGLAEINAAAAAVSGTLIAYATAPGQLAFDAGDGASNGPYARALTAALRVPGATLEEIFRQAARRVSGETRGRQIPWVSSSLLDRVELAAANTEEAARGRAAYQAATEAAAWERVRAKPTIPDVEWFLHDFPSSVYADQAKATLASLRQEAVAEELRRAGADAGYGVALRLRSAAGQAPAMEVVTVGRTSPFAGEILAGDLITRINNQPITTQTDPGGLLTNAVAATGNVVIMFRRGAASYQVAVRPR